MASYRETPRASVSGPSSSIGTPTACSASGTRSDAAPHVADACQRRQEMRAARSSAVEAWTTARAGFVVVDEHERPVAPLAASPERARLELVPTGPDPAGGVP